MWRISSFRPSTDTLAVSRILSSRDGFSANVSVSIRTIGKLSITNRPPQCLTRKLFFTSTDINLRINKKTTRNTIHFVMYKRFLCNTFGAYTSHVLQWARPNRFLDLKKIFFAKRCMISLTALYIIIYKSSDDLVAGLTSLKCYDFARHCVLFIYRLSCSRKTISNLARLHIIIISHIRMFSSLDVPRLSLTRVTSTVYDFLSSNSHAPVPVYYNIIWLLFYS